MLQMAEAIDADGGLSSACPSRCRPTTGTAQFLAAAFSDWFVLNSCYSVCYARSLRREVGWMADEKVNKDTSAECFDTQAMVPERRISPVSYTHLRAHETRHD